MDWRYSSKGIVSKSGSAVNVVDTEPAHLKHLKTLYHRMVHHAGQIFLESIQNMLLVADFMLPDNLVEPDQFMAPRFRLAKIAGQQAAADVHKDYNRHAYRSKRRPVAMARSLPVATSPVVIVADKLDTTALGVPVKDISELNQTEKEAALIEHNPEFLLVRSETEVKEPTLIDALTRLFALIRGGHGKDNVDEELLKAHGIRVYTTGGSEIPVAGLVMRKIARVVQGDEYYKRDESPPSFVALSEWREALEEKIKKKSPEEQVERRTMAARALPNIGLPTLAAMNGKTIGIIGFGSIAQQLADDAKVAGMDVLVYAPSLGCGRHCGHGVSAIEWPRASTSYARKRTLLFR